MRKLLLILLLSHGGLHSARAQWVQTNGPYGGIVNCLAVSGTNLFAGTGRGGVFLSTNNGTSWTAVNNGLTNTNVYALAVSPASGGTGGTNLFAGTWGDGVFLSTNNGISWTAVNTGLTNTRVWSLAVSPASGRTGGTNLFAGTDGSVWRRPLAEMVPYATFTSTDHTLPSLEITEPRVVRGMRLAARTLVVRGKATDESGIFEVKINDSDAKLFANGEFWAEVRLAVGENRIRVTATDTRGNTAEQMFTVVREAEAVAPPPTAGETLIIGEYHALVMAVSEYEDTRIQPLHNPVRDAEKLISVLTRKYGFRSSNIRFLRNPTRAEIISAFTRLQGALQGNENVLVFYAGHGYWNDVIKQGYWLPRDARKDNPANWISNADVRLEASNLGIRC